jgi:hypothetical protein
MIGVLVMAENIYENSDVESMDELSFDSTQQKKSQLVFTIVGVEPQFPEEHEPFDVYFNFENLGSVDAGEFIIRMITASKDNNYLGVDIEDQTISSLKTGGKERILLKFGYGMPAGTYLINAYLDYFNQIHEENENTLYRHASHEIIVG